MKHNNSFVAPRKMSFENREGGDRTKIRAYSNKGYF